MWDVGTLASKHNAMHGTRCLLARCIGCSGRGRKAWRDLLLARHMRRSMHAGRRSGGTCPQSFLRILRGLRACIFCTFSHACIAHFRMHIFACMRAHFRMHAYVYVHIFACMRMCMCLRMHAYVYFRICACMRMCIFACMRMCIACMHMCMHIFKFACMRMCQKIGGDFNTYTLSLHRMNVNCSCPNVLVSYLNQQPAGLYDGEQALWYEQHMGVFRDMYAAAMLELCSKAMAGQSDGEEEFKLEWSSSNRCGRCCDLWHRSARPRRRCDLCVVNSDVM